MQIPTLWRRLGLAIAVGSALTACGKGTTEAAKPHADHGAAHTDHQQATDTKLSLSEAEQAQVDAIAADLHKHIAILASDKFEGRAPATKGEELTVNYLADQFKALGLEPGAMDAAGKPSWFQQVPIVEMEIETTP